MKEENQIKLTNNARNGEAKSRSERVMENANSIKKNDVLVEGIRTNDSTEKHNENEKTLEAQNDPKEVMEYSKKLLEAREYEKAEKIIVECLTKNPKNPYLLTQLIKTYTLMGRMDKAREVFDYAIKAHPKNETLYRVMINGYSRTNEIEKAREICNIAIENCNKKSQIFEDMFMVYYYNGHIEEARQLCREAWEKKAITPKMYTLLAEHMEKIGDKDRAVKILEFAINNKEYDKIIITRLIKLYGEKGEIGKAEQIFYSEELGTKDQLIYAAMIDVYIQNGMIEKAETILKNLQNEIKLENEIIPELAAPLIRLAEERGDIDSAKKIFKQVKEAGKADIVLHTQLLSIYEKHDLFEEGMKLIDEMIETATNDERSYARMIFFCGKAGNIQKAEEIFYEAKKKFSSGLIYSAMISVYYKEKEYDKASEIFFNMPDNVSNKDEVEDLFIEVLRKKKKYEKVIERCEEIIKHEKKMERKIKALIIKGYALKDSGRVGEAIASFNAALRLIDTKNIHYPRAACGLVFCRAKLLPKKAYGIKDDLLRWLDKKNGNCLRDIKNALEILKNEYELEFNDEELERIKR